MSRLRIILSVAAVLAAALVLRASVSAARWPWTPSPARVTHEMVATQVRDVAKLVSTELTLRDVVTVEQSKFGMHRRTLLVVTGKVLAGIDLGRDVDVRIDHAARRIIIELPHAQVLGVEVLNTHTYDESSGLLFGFKPEDRDAIQAQIRTQLRAAGEQSGLLPQADRSARTLLQSLLARDGYTVEISTRTQLGAPAPAR